LKVLKVGLNEEVADKADKSGSRRGEKDSSDGDSGDGSLTDSFIPAGSFAKAALLNGVDAPTGGNAQQNPMPMLFRVLDDAQLPNNFRGRLKDCFVLGDGHGDLSSERVMVRLNTLSCVDESGGAIELKVKGWITDETGSVGARGKLVTKTGQVLANAMMSGVLSGIGKGIRADSAQQNTTITGAVTETVTNPWRAGLGEGIGKSFDRISEYYLKLADKIFPVVEVDPGRVVDIVFAQGARLERRGDSRK
jgi:conjugal transfer pilus assembly protein TraB